jgi:enterochelin esterase-like enzyme
VATYFSRVLMPGVILAVAGMLAMSLVTARASDPAQPADPEAGGAPLTDPSGTPQASSPTEGNAADQAAPAAATSIATSQPAVSRIIVGSFYSHALQEQRSFQIYFPPSYDRAPDRAYPVLFLLHGDGGRITDWAAFGLQSKMDRAIANGMPQMIVVMPDGSGHYGDATDWANRADGSDPIEEQVLELVTFVDQTYRTLTDRSNRFIGGLSSGGFGALNIALHRPDLFSTAMSFSGFIAADDPEADPGVFGEDPAYLTQNSPAVLLTSQTAAGDIYYVLSGGQDDAYFQHRMADFSAELDRLGIAHEFHVVPGAHDGNAWIAGLDFGLAHISSQLRAGYRMESPASQ